MNTIRPIRFAASFLVLASCGSTSSPAQKADASAEDIAQDANPYGKAYPSKGFGTSAHSGSLAGGVFQNFRFYGHPNGDASKGMQPLSMAKFFDPEMRAYKIVVLTATAPWCTYCKKETTEIIAARNTFSDRKIGVIQVVVESQSSGIGATQVDFDNWVRVLDHNFDVALDESKRNLGAFVQAGGLPYALVLDARTMEILYSGVGAPANVETAFDRYVSWVDSNPPTAY